MKYLLLLLLIPGLLRAGELETNLISNGSFEEQPVGTAIGSPPARDVSGLFPGWRFLCQNDQVGFGAVVIPEASDGASGMRLDAHAPENGMDGYAFDRDSDRIAVEPGARYAISFDAAWIGGNSHLLGLRIEEFGGDGTKLAETMDRFEVNGESYQRIEFDWTPGNSGAREINLAFIPGADMGCSMAIKLDNVRMTRKPE